MGKAGREPAATRSTGFEPDLTDGDGRSPHLADPLARPAGAPAGASTRLVYDLFAYARTRDQAAAAAAWSRARSPARPTSPTWPTGELPRGSSTRFAYSDGFGREIQQQDARPSPARSSTAARTSRRAGSAAAGRSSTTRASRSGSTSRSSPRTHRFESDVQRRREPDRCATTRSGAPVATLHPDHTWEKVVFDPWRQETWDVNDTVLIADPATDPDVGGLLARLPADADYLPTWYAAARRRRARRRTSRPPRQGGGARGHARPGARSTRSAAPSSPSRTTGARNAATLRRRKRSSATRIVLDIEGNQREVVDALGRTVDALRLRPARPPTSISRAWTPASAGCSTTSPASRYAPGTAAAHRVPHRLRRAAPPGRDVPARPGRRSPRRARGLVEQTVYGEGQPDDRRPEPARPRVTASDGAGDRHHEALRLQGQPRWRAPVAWPKSYRRSPTGRATVAGRRGLYTARPPTTR